MNEWHCLLAHGMHTLKTNSLNDCWYSYIILYITTTTKKKTKTKQKLFSSSIASDNKMLLHVVHPKNIFDGKWGRYDFGPKDKRKMRVDGS